MAGKGTYHERMAQLEKILSIVAGVQVEIFIRDMTSEHFFVTISTDGDQLEAMQKLLKFFGPRMTGASMDFDPECNQTCLWGKLA